MRQEGTRTDAAGEESMRMSKASEGARGRKRWEFGRWESRFDGFNKGKHKGMEAFEFKGYFRQGKEEAARVKGSAGVCVCV